MVELPPSRLPRDPDYWEELARRVREDAAEPLRAYAGQQAWYGVVAHRALWLVAASIVLIAMIWLALPPSERSPELAWIEAGVRPDEAAGFLIGGPGPPTVGELMPLFYPLPGEESR